MKNIVLIFLFILCLSSLALAEADQISLTTYYPAPFGMYQEVRVSGKLGVGTKSPNAKLEVVHNLDTDVGIGNGLYYTEYGNSDSGGSLLVLRRARGTEASPSAVAYDDTMLLRPSPYDGSSFIRPAYVGFRVSGPVSANNVPMDFVVGTGSGAGSDDIKWGIERMRITNDGMVGIGTSAPTRALEIRANQAGASAVKISNADPTGGSSVTSFDQAGTGQIGGVGYSNPGAALNPNTFHVGTSNTAAATNIPFLFLTRGLERMRISPVGNVGIGTINPTHALELRANSPISAARISNANPAGWAGVDFYDDQNTFHVGALGYANAGGNLYFGTSNDGGTGNPAPVTFMTQDKERMRIAPDGKIGIGTNNPTRFIDIKSNEPQGGTIKISNADPAGGAGIVFFNRANTVKVAGIGYSNESAASGFLNSFIIGTEQSSDVPFVFLTENNERMRITPSGEIGIGTATPAAGVKLDVNGPVKVGKNDALVCSASTVGTIRMSEGAQVAEINPPLTAPLTAPNSYPSICVQTSSGYAWMQIVTSQTISVVTP